MVMMVRERRERWTLMVMMVREGRERWTLMVMMVREGRERWTLMRGGGACVVDSDLMGGREAEKWTLKGRDSAALPLLVDEVLVSVDGVDCISLPLGGVVAGSPLAGSVPHNR